MCGYVWEEIIVEFIVVVIGRDLGIVVILRKENVQYLKSWLLNLKEDFGYVMSVLWEVGKVFVMIEESMEKQYILVDIFVREEDIFLFFIKEYNESVIYNIL